MSSPHPHARGRVRFAWLAVAACIAAILLFSGEEFAARNTSGILAAILRWIFPQIGADDLQRAHLLVRKGAHLSEYGVLGLLAFRALWLSLASPAPKLALMALALVLGVAATDELRQSFLPSRTGALADVALDALGGAIGLGAVLAAQRAAGVAAPARAERRSA